METPATVSDWYPEYQLYFYGILQEASSESISIFFSDLKQATKDLEQAMIKDMADVPEDLKNVKEGIRKYTKMYQHVARYRESNPGVDTQVRKSFLPV